MKILANYNKTTYKGANLKFVANIRDRDVSVFEKLQKQKIETLLKYREAKKIVEYYQELLNKYANSGIKSNIITDAKRDLEEMKVFKNTLWNKLHEINLALLKEEEKNY